METLPGETDGYCDNCKNRSSHIKEFLCPKCYKEIVLGDDEET